jgi:stage V sporulation protein S
VTEILRVSAQSQPTAVAGAVAALLRKTGVVELHVVGAGALNQAVKAIAIARGFLLQPGCAVVCRPTFEAITIDGQAFTAICLVVEAQGHLSGVAIEDLADLDLKDLEIEDPNLEDLEGGDAGPSPPADPQLGSSPVLLP